MLRKINELLSAQSSAGLRAFSLLLVAFIGESDYFTGYEISFSIFYLIPIAISSWYLTGRFWLLICLLAAAVWMGVDLSSGHTYSNPAVPPWNASVRLGFFLVVAMLVRRVRFSIDQQASLAQIDGLTGLLNARTFRQNCASALKLASRNQRPFVLGYIDLDGFKGINDSLGHSGGDEVLKAVAVTLADRLRGSDIAARLGGDEFVVLLPETGLAGAKTFFTRLHESLLGVARHNSWPLGFSVGVIVFHSFNGSVEEAIQQADALMYRVKRTGKNRIVFEETRGLPGQPQAAD